MLWLSGGLLLVLDPTQVEDRMWCKYETLLVC